MPDFTNIVTVDLTEATGYNVEAHRAVHQWDSGVILQLTGATFPQGTTCQFDTKTTTFNQELTDGACEIPNALLGYDMIGDIKAHVKIDDDNYGIVVYDIHIPVIRRPKPDSYIYTDNSSSSNGWIKSRYGYRVNEDQTILGRTELSINDNQTILDGTSLSLNNQQTVLDGTHLSLASGLFYADATHLQLNSGRITIGPTQLLVDSRVFGTVNMFDLSKCNNGQFDNNGNLVNGLGCASDFIAVKEGTSYRVSKPSGIRLYSIVYYDKLQLFKRKITPGADLNYTFTTATGEVYVRLEFRRGDGTDIPISDFGPIQMEEGSVESNIVTHALDNSELTKRRFLQNFESKNLVPMGILQQGGINSDSGATPFYSSSRCRTDFISVKPDTTYTVSMSPNASPSAVRCYQVKSTLYSTITQPVEHSNILTFRVPSGCHYIRLVIVNSTSSSNDLAVSSIANFQFELGPEATPYQPYALNSSENCYVNDLKSKNIYDYYNKVYLGAASSTTGDDIDKNLGGNNYISTGAIAVKPNCVYTFSSKQQGLASGYNLSVGSVREAGSNRAITGYQNFNNSPMPCTFITGASTYWINIVIGTGTTEVLSLSNITDMQLEEGPYASPYSPFAETNTELSDRTRGIANPYGTWNAETLLTGYAFLRQYNEGSDQNYRCAINGSQFVGPSDFMNCLNFLRNNTAGARTGTMAINTTYSPTTGLVIDSGWYHYLYIPARWGGQYTDNNLHIDLWLWSQQVANKSFHLQFTDVNSQLSLMHGSRSGRWAQGFYNNVTGVNSPTCTVNENGVVTLQIHVKFNAAQNAYFHFAQVPKPLESINIVSEGVVKTFQIISPDGIIGRVRLGNNSVAANDECLFIATYITDDKSYYYQA